MQEEPESIFYQHDNGIHNNKSKLKNENQQIGKVENIRTGGFK